MRSISEMSYANIEIIFQKVLSFLCVMVYNICIEFVRGVFMKFCDKLNEYIETLSCTSKELCELSGISERMHLKIYVLPFRSLQNGGKEKT